MHRRPCLLLIKELIAVGAIIIPEEAIVEEGEIIVEEVEEEIGAEEGIIVVVAKVDVNHADRIWP
jgi:hypothetical protein